MESWRRKSNKSQKVENIRMGNIHKSVYHLMNIAIISLSFHRLNVYIAELNKKFYLLEVEYHEVESDWIVNYEIFSDKDINRLKDLFYKRNSSHIKSLKNEIKRKNLEIKKANRFLKSPSEAFLSYKEI